MISGSFRSVASRRRAGICPVFRDIDCLPYCSRSLCTRSWIEQSLDQAARGCQVSVEKYAALRMTSLLVRAECRETKAPAKERRGLVQDMPDQIDWMGCRKAASRHPLQPSRVDANRAPRQPLCEAEQNPFR